MSRILLMVGTKKGAFFFESDEERGEWRFSGPSFKGWEVLDLQLDQRQEKKLYACVGHHVYGSCIHVSDDLGKSWQQIERGPSYSKDSGRVLERIWCIAPGHPEKPEELYAGVGEAGLFVSRNGGAHWHEVDAINNHPTREEWTPGLGGLCCHTILIDPINKDRLWVAISAAGVFRSDDAGETWELRNQGLPCTIHPYKASSLASCVHSMALSPDAPDILYQQHHQGVFRSTNGGDSWHPIHGSLQTHPDRYGEPIVFGLPMVMHPTDSKTLFIAPLESDKYRHFKDGEFLIYTTQNGGESWQPSRVSAYPCYSGVLRQAMAVDDLKPCGIYLGTTCGQVFYSRNQAESWNSMPVVLPRILSVTAVTV